MSADICVFHGSEIDDPSLLPGTADGWYVGAFGGFAGVGEAVDPESICGPFPSQQAAAEAMSDGCWIALGYSRKAGGFLPRGRL